MELHDQARLGGEMASMAKYWSTELENKVAADCLQLHGGWGFMWETQIAKCYAGKFANNKLTPPPQSPDQESVSHRGVFCIYVCVFMYVYLCHKGLYHLSINVCIISVYAAH